MVAKGSWGGGRRSGIRGDQKCTRYSSVEGGENTAFRPGELQEMGIGGLFRGFDPGGEMRDILIVGEEREFCGSGCLEPKQ